MALTKFKCNPVIHQHCTPFGKNNSTWSKHGWYCCDRKRDKHLVSGNIGTFGKTKLCVSLTLSVYWFYLFHHHFLSGIPIDMVGGTSMGSFVGAAYAESGDVNKMCQKVREWSMVRMLVCPIFPRFLQNFLWHKTSRSLLLLLAQLSLRTRERRLGKSGAQALCLV